MKEYGRVNRLAMKLLSPDGLLVSASCSQSVDEDAVVGVLRRNLPRLQPEQERSDLYCAPWQANH